MSVKLESTRCCLLLAALLGLVMPAGRVTVRAAALPQAAVDDAYVEYDEGRNAWILGNSTIRYEVTLGSTAGLVASALADGSGTSWTIDGTAESSFTVDGRAMTLGNAQAPLLRHAAEVADGGVHLSLVFRVANEPIEVTRHYVVYPASPAVETWLEFAVTGATPRTVGSLVVWKQGVSATEARWVNGLQTSPGEGAPFGRRQVSMGAGRNLEIFSEERSSSHAVPVLWLEGEGGQFVGGVMWSGEWSITAQRQGAVVRTALGFGSLVTSVSAGRPFETPHVFFGVTAGGLAESSAGLRSFVEHGVRRSRPFEERVIYNTWFAYGVNVDEGSMRQEVRRAAEVGAELFVLDAGWYSAETGDYGDFAVNLGSWATDAGKFPSGLRTLAEYTRGLGMDFGLWVEPERVALTTVNEPGLARESWLAMENGRYAPPLSNTAADAAQVCLADPEARQWVLDQLFALIDDVQPDYLKWDNNLWVNCNRAGHGHGSLDGNFAHVRALYEVLAALRERYPYLRVENCSGGGNRLDFGMLRLTDVAWMDDQSVPAARVRGHLEGLSLAFPAPYLFSFVMSDEVEDMHDHPDLSLLFRSRMPGLLGLTYVAAEFGEAQIARMQQEVAFYKQIRGRLRDATSILLTDQAEEGKTDAWDVVQTLSEGSGDALLFAYQGESAGESVHVWPQRLDPTATYDIDSIDTGPLGEASGASLLEDGIEIEASETSRALILLLTKVTAGSGGTGSGARGRP